MTLTELTAEVYELLLEPTAANGRMNPTGTESTVYRHLNDGYVRFCRETGCLQREVTIAVVSGTGTYVLPNDLLNIRSAVYCTTSTTVIDSGTPAVINSYRDIEIIKESEAVNYWGFAYLKNNYPGVSMQLWISKQSGATSFLPSITLSACPTLPSVTTETVDGVTTVITTTASILLNIKCFPVASPTTEQYGLMTTGASVAILRPEVASAPAYYAAARMGLTMLADDPAVVARAQAALSLWGEVIDIMKVQTFYG